MRALLEDLLILGRRGSHGYSFGAVADEVGVGDQIAENAGAEGSLALGNCDKPEVSFGLERMDRRI